jgi:hypothetical protein
VNKIIDRGVLENQGAKKAKLSTAYVRSASLFIEEALSLFSHLF